MIRPCSARDLELAVAGAHTRQGADHYRERFAWHQAGDAILLLAWDGDRVAGRATLTFTSRYPEVRARDPLLAEVNALGANPTGHGTGTRLLETAIAICRERGVPELGLAVAEDNPAGRLYRRLGFAEWGGGEVVDTWTQPGDDGSVIEHADRCVYLLRSVALS